jgi:GNAT superfamily N-acetyltransferase
MTGPTPGRVHIGAGAEGDLAALPGLEVAAGQVFRALGMDAVADDAPPSQAELRRFLRSGGLLVARGRPNGQPVAYALLEAVDGCLHVEQVSVHPDHARHGIGRALLDHAARRAADAGLPALTLTTFADVPWNAPYYARCGFRVLDAREETPGLRRLRAAEAAAGLDRWPRLCMRRDLGPADGEAQ